MMLRFERIQSPITTFSLSNTIFEKFSSPQKNWQYLWIPQNDNFCRCQKCPFFRKHPKANHEQYSKSEITFVQNTKKTKISPINSLKISNFCCQNIPPKIVNPVKFCVLPGYANFLCGYITNKFLLHNHFFLLFKPQLRTLNW